MAHLSLECTRGGTTLGCPSRNTCNIQIISLTAVTFGMTFTVWRVRSLGGSANVRLEVILNEWRHRKCQSLLLFRPGAGDWISGTWVLRCEGETLKGAKSGWSGWKMAKKFARAKSQTTLVSVVTTLWGVRLLMWILSMNIQSHTQKYKYKPSNNDGNNNSIKSSIKVMIKLRLYKQFVLCISNVSVLCCPCGVFITVI